MHSVGFPRQDLDKPQIAIVNFWTEVNPGPERQNKRLDFITKIHIRGL